MQIIIQNIQSNLSESIKPFAFFNKNINSENIIEVILEGKVITKICKNNIDELLKLNYDFILYSDTFKNLTHKRIIYPDNLHISNKINDSLFVCEPSEIKFILSEIILEDKKINIDFKINNQNYYVCDNIFTSKFIVYFLNEYYSEEIKDLSLDKIMNYKVKILDQNVNEESFDFKNKIKINKTTSNIFFSKNKKKFNIIYVDGAHDRKSVESDAINAFKYLNKNGIIIFDDFLWSNCNKDLYNCPINALLPFLRKNRNRIEILHINYQLIVKKKY
jgi:hypothetical protein